MKIARYLIGGLLFVVLASVVAFAAAAFVYRDIPAADLEAKYAGPASRFLNVDGVRIHYRDEGKGPVIVLLHANFGNLIGWDPWVEVLQDAYRVVRMDFTSHGLTGPDPTGDYSIERTLELTEKFIDGLGLTQFSIAGTSIGGTIAMHYAHAHPERIDKLILLSPGALEGRERTGEGRGLPRAAYLLTYILPRALPEFMLRQGFGDDTKLSDELIDRWYDLWMREGQRKAQLDRLSQYDSGNTLDIIRALTPPTLLMWGEANTQAKFEQHEEFIELLDNTASLHFISYPGVGHMAVQEAGRDTGLDVRAYMDGTLDVPPLH